MPKNSCIMQIWAESGKSALPICNYSQILYHFLTFTQNLKRSRLIHFKNFFLNQSPYRTIPCMSGMGIFLCLLFQFFILKLKFFYLGLKFFYSCFCLYSSFLCFCTSFLCFCFPSLRFLIRNL